MKLIDDATSKRMARLSEEETIFSAHGVAVALDRPLWHSARALYTDKKNAYVVDEKTRQRCGREWPRGTDAVRGRL
jgi:hypothetical protein